MRDKGGTLCSPAIDRKKSSSGFPGAKTNGHNNAMPTGVSVGRLKGGSTLLLSGSSRDLGHNSELLDHHPTIATKKSKDPVDSEALKRKAPTPSSHDDGALPQWRQGKRSRCSRIEPKHAVSSPSGADEPTSKTSTRIEKQQAMPSLPPPPPPPPPALVQPNGSSKIRGHSAVRPGAAASINSKKEEITTGRNGLANTSANNFTRASGNGCPLADARVRQITAGSRGRSGEQERDCGRASPQKKGADPPVSTVTSHRNHVLNNSGSNSYHRNHTTDAAAALFEVKEVDPTTTTPAPLGPADDNIKHPLASTPGRVDIETLEWPRILITLSRKEKEEDFLAIKNSKLPQRPKKRPKVVEKALQFITPGNWLTDLSRGRYDVREKKCTKKKPGGLKAMESLESDSE